MFCKDKQFYFDKNRTVYSYTGIQKELYLLYKIQGWKPLAHYFAEKLYRLYLSHLYPLPIVPVPCSISRRKNKGWDPIGYIAKILKHDYQARVIAILVRRTSKQQKTLTATERAENVQGKYCCRSIGELPEQVVLLDDVFTTGSTMNECARILKEKGIKKIYSLSICRD